MTLQGPDLADLHGALKRTSRVFLAFAEGIEFIECDVRIDRARRVDLSPRQPESDDRACDRNAVRNIRSFRKVLAGL
jgi:hypothetical protein